MPQPNIDPIWSKAADAGTPVMLLTQAADVTGVSMFNRVVWTADANNGGYLVGLLFKPRGANVATIARIYQGNGNENTNFATAPAAPTGTPSSSGGTMLSGTYFATVVAIGPGGSLSVVGTFSSGVTVTGPTGSIAWSWTAVNGATSYRIYVGPAGGATGFARHYFTSGTNSYSQTAMPETGTLGDPQTGNQTLIDEVQLPSASAGVANSTIPWIWNKPFPAGNTILVGLSATVAGGVQVTPMASKY
jgi:hypothetical protein